VEFLEFLANNPFMAFLLVLLIAGGWAGISAAASWVGKQIELKRSEPRKMIEAQAKLTNAEAKRDQARTRRLEAEAGIFPEKGQDDLDAAIQQAELEAKTTKEPSNDDAQPQLAEQ
jgi:hypothetical protein